MPKPQLTPEEKLELKAFMKAEKKRLAELAIIQQKHDHLSREVKFGRLTVSRHEKNWKKMLIRIALPRMRVDLKFAWHNFERVIDSKDFTISLLMDEIHDAEEQYMRNLKCHSENIDRLILKFSDRLEELKADNEHEITSKQIAAEKEVEEIRACAAENELYLKTMLFGLEMARKEQEKLVRGDHLSKIDEECSKYSDILQNLKLGLETTFSKIWYDTRTFFKQYTAHTAERRKAYDILAQQDASLQNMCSHHKVKLSSMQEYLKTCKIRYINLQETEGQAIGDLMQERQYFADAFWTLRNRLAADRALDETNLEILAVQSNETAKYLNAIEKKGERILSLAAVCRKLETRLEKILPFPVDDDSMDNYCCDIKLEEFNQMENLKLFWRRVAQADAIRHSINEEREYLKRENNLLKVKIHHYCECLDCEGHQVEPPKENKPGEKINIVLGNFVHYQ